MQVIQVVAALFSRKTEFGKWEILIFQRANHVSGAGFWEFPGGKIEKSEDPQSALIREIKEELNVRIKVQKYIAESSYSYIAGKEIRLTLYAAELMQSCHFDLVDHKDWAWVSLDELHRYQLSQADRPLVAPIGAFLDHRSM